MKAINFKWFALLWSLTTFSVLGQNVLEDSLKTELSKVHHDTTRVRILYTLAFRNAGIDTDTALMFSQQALALAEKINYENGIFWSEITLSGALGVLGNYPLSMEYGLKAFEIAQRTDVPIQLAFANGNLSDCYYFMGDFEKSLQFEKKCASIASKSFNNELYYMWLQQSRIFYAMNVPDSALIYGRKANKRITELNQTYDMAIVSPVIGNAMAANKHYDSALIFYRRGIRLAGQLGTEVDLIDSYNGVAAVYHSLGLSDSSLWYARNVATRRIRKSYPTGMLKAAQLMVDIYGAKNNSDSTLKYLRIVSALKDSLFNREKTIAVQNLTFREQEKSREIAVLKTQFRRQLQLYISMAAIIVISAVVIVYIRNRRQRQLQRIRNSIADDLHDDIGSTLSSIGIMSELAKSKSPEATSILNSIGESTMTIQDNMSDIVWAIKSDDSFEQVKLRMNQFAAEILSARNIDFEFEDGSAQSDLRLTMHQRKNIFLLFKEAINNAAKYSSAKSVVISIALISRRLRLIIRDDGKGFDTTQTHSGNGLASMRRRASELGGDLNIKSEVNHGTAVSLEFKIR